MTAFFLKLLACLAMLIDHSALVFQQPMNEISPWLYVVCRMIGRLAFPLFALGIAEGAVHTSSPKKYLTRMFVFAILAQIPFSLMTGTVGAERTFTLLGKTVPYGTSLSVMVTLFLGLAVCVAIHEGKHFAAVPALVAAYVIDRTIGMDYGFLGVLFIVCLYLARGNKLTRLAAVLLFAACFYMEHIKAGIVNYANTGTFNFTVGLMYCAAMAFSGFIMLFYNRKRGPSAKLFIYFFYPVHMLVLWALWFVNLFM